VLKTYHEGLGMVAHPTGFYINDDSRIIAIGYELRRYIGATTQE
jgi:hypothetical protein